MEGNTTYLEESPGVQSLIRVLSERMFWVATVFTFLMLALYAHAFERCLFLDRTPPPFDPLFIWLIMVFYAFAFFPKVAQKLIEQKFGVKADDNNKT